MPVATDIARPGARRWRSCAWRKPSRRIVVATSGYVGVVAALSIASSWTQDSVGPALYIVAALLTLPTGMLIYPALWVNLIVAGAIAHLFGLGPDAEQVVIELGVTVVFCLAALTNSVLVRSMWQSIRGLR